MKRFLGYLMLAGLLGACAPKAPVETVPPASDADDDAQDAAPAEDRLTIAVIPKQLDNPVFGYAHEGAKRAAEQLGVDLEWDAPAQNDEAKQADIFNTFVEQGVDGIAVSCINPEIMGAAIDAAVDKGIHVVTWDSDAPNSKRDAFYGMDDLATGKLLGEELAALLPDGGKVAILSGVQGAQNLADRVAGAKETLAANPKIEVVETYYCGDSLPKSAEIISDVMAQHPDLAGWLMVGGWPLFTNEGLSAIKPGETNVVAVDPLPAAQHWIEDGYVQVCVGQKVFGWGEESVKLLHTLCTGGTIETKNGFVDSGVDIVVKDKTGRYADAKYTALADYAKQFDAAEAGGS